MSAKIISAEDFMDMLNGGGSSPRARLPVDIHARRLVDHYADLQKKNELRVGMLIRGKPGFAHPSPLMNGYPAIMLEMFEEERFRGISCRHDGTPFNCTLLGLLDDEAVDFVYHTDKLEQFDFPQQPVVSAVASPKPDAKPAAA